MKSIDLKVGNKIYGSSDRIETVTLIKDDNYIFSYPGLLREANSEQELAGCKGIPIAEDILILIGFVWNLTKNAMWNEHEFLICKDVDGTFYSAVWGCDLENQPELICVCQIPFIHTLQNLHYTFTGHEINLDKL